MIYMERRLSTIFIPNTNDVPWTTGADMKELVILKEGGGGRHSLKTTYVIGKQAHQINANYERRSS